MKWLILVGAAASLHSAHAGENLSLTELRRILNSELVLENIHGKLVKASVYDATQGAHTYQALLQVENEGNVENWTVKVEWASGGRFRVSDYEVSQVERVETPPSEVKIVRKALPANTLMPPTVPSETTWGCFH